ncbi:probable methyltransferase-like protein 15 homolog [Leptinotarsa decemlineata]|uniref:probable methyltransferase-like protein 15 homolog n=1 Tax=Leptinotarsa decemlineata TaxID=7539 RepID=UPI003D30620B
MLLKRVIFRNLLRNCSTQHVEQKAAHVPVMTEEVLNFLKPNSNETETIIDMTFGAGGHSRRLLEKFPNTKLIVLDRDPIAMHYADKLAEEFPFRVVPLLGRFSDLPVLLKSKGIKQNSVDNILFDFGCSSMQFDEAHRGFSVSAEGPLDMRMDGNRVPNSVTAADVLAKATEEDLFKIIKFYGEEKQAKKIARAIVEARYLFKKLTTTKDLADLVESVCSEDHRLDKLRRKTHVATKTFQALRIFVNNELNEINYGLLLAHRYLRVGGRVVTITFHSLEDTIVKRQLMGNMIDNIVNPLPLKYMSHSDFVDEGLVKEVMESNWKMLHQHVIVPTLEEVENNARSRSAKLRAAVKLK